MMFPFYIHSFLKKCQYKLTKPNNFKHVSWQELLLYSYRQAYHNYRNTYTRGLTTYQPFDTALACVETPAGTIYLPHSVYGVGLRYLLRETFDNNHWHHYDTPMTPVTYNDVVIDCGASVGLWSLSIINRAKKVYLIEPQKVFTQALEKTFAPYLTTEKVTIFNCAVGNVDGKCKLIQNQDADFLAFIKPDPSGKVPLHRLDTLFDKISIDFIKVDIEGQEMELLEGAETVILRDMPRLAIAVYHEANNWRDMKDYVLSLVPDYKWKLKGMVYWGKPLMLHLWV